MGQSKAGSGDDTTGVLIFSKFYVFFFIVRVVKSVCVAGY